MNKPALPQPLALAFCLTLAGCSGEHHPPAAQDTRPVVQAQVSVLQPVEIPATAITSGSVVALESVHVSSRLMGYIRDIAVAEGQTVKAGQRLFSIDPLDIAGAVEQARLGLKQAEDALKDAKTDHDRFASLYQDDVVSRQQYEKMRLNYDIAASHAAQAKAGLNTAQGQMRYATVTSPINGVVTQKLAMAGDLAAPGQPVLMVENPAKLQVQTTVPEVLFQGLRPGQAVRVEIDGQEGTLTAEVARLSPAADPTTHSYTVKLDVAAPGLKSGSFARVLFPIGKKLMLAVPKAALLDRAGITGVFVVDAQGTAQYRMVRTGAEHAGRIEILSGLNPGERVVTGHAEAVNNGDQIRG